MPVTRQRQGFTLIELLIVVAIIAILALIAVPNFLEAQTRAKVSRTQADMRSLATAMETYRIDHNSVPPVDSWDTLPGWPASDKKTIPGPFWIMLSSPVSYLPTPVRDPFVPGHTITAMGGSTHPTLDVWLQVGVGSLGTTNSSGQASEMYCISSFGPDFSDEAPNLGAYPYTNAACPYDPTNGTVSRGDLYRHSDRPPTNYLSDRHQNVGPPPGLTPWW